MRFKLIPAVVYTNGSVAIVAHNGARDPGHQAVSLPQMDRRPSLQNMVLSQPFVRFYS